MIDHRSRAAPVPHPAAMSYVHRHASRHPSPDRRRLRAGGATGDGGVRRPRPGAPAPAPGEFPGVGRHHWGTFDGEELVARVVGREYHSWFGGAEVPTTGIAAVTVVAERRGQGLLDDLFRAVLAEGRDRGEVISTLFPTAPESTAATATSWSAPTTRSRCRPRHWLRSGRSRGSPSGAPGRPTSTPYAACTTPGHAPRTGRSPGAESPSRPARTTSSPRSRG